MKTHKKKKIKGFRKKSMWPSILLFLVFLSFCLLVTAAFIGIFAAYIMDTKMEGVGRNAEHLGRLITARIKEEPLTDVVAYVGGYLNKEMDICVTDDDGQVLLHMGDSELPEFREDKMRTVEFINSYRLIPAQSSKWIDLETDEFNLDISELWNSAMEKMPPPGPGNWEGWMNEEIQAISYWTELPTDVKGRHVYYKDRITLLRKDVFYILMAGLVALLILLVPILLMFINLLSSIIMQKRMVNVLYLDTTTGGRNWLYFVQRCQKILRRFRNARNVYAVVNLHMDRYQDYCACYGNRAGEELLESIYAYLQAKTDRNETFARFAKADFGLFLRCDSLEQCEKRLRKMLAELTGIERERKQNYHAGLCLLEPVENANRKHRRQADIDQLYHYANAARETLHDEEGQYIRVFDEQILEEQLWKRKVEDTMETALLNKEFQIYLQPKFNPVSGKMVGAEALVRWISPTEGRIDPNRFIPLFEENGFITRLDDYMISSVAKLQSEWKLQGKKQIPVSVNVSRANFTKSDLAEHICHLVDGYGADHGGIELEVTESAFFGDKDMLQKIIRELKLYGFHISMDDFGAGYSSLNSLKDLPIDVLKLDMDFFRGEDTGKRGEIVVRETIRLAKNLDMKIVAEGIEREDQVEFLAEQGCDMIQGYYYAKPMPVAEFEEKAMQEMI